MIGPSCGDSDEAWLRQSSAPRGQGPPVNREVYDQSIDFLRRSVEQAKLGLTEKRDALRQLAVFLRRGEDLTQRQQRGRGSREERDSRSLGVGIRTLNTDNRTPLFPQ